MSLNNKKIHEEVEAILTSMNKNSELNPMEKSIALRLAAEHIEKVFTAEIQLQALHAVFSKI